MIVSLARVVPSVPLLLFVCRQNGNVDKPWSITRLYSDCLEVGGPCPRAGARVALFVFFTPMHFLRCRPVRSVELLVSRRPSHG